VKFPDAHRTSPPSGAIGPSRWDCVPEAERERLRYAFLGYQKPDSADGNTPD
jgi:hypothetical protein